MILKSRLNERTKENIKDYKVKFYNEEDRVSTGFLIGLASEKIDDLTDEILENALQICAARKDDNVDNASMSITLRQDVYDKILQFQKRLEELSCTETMHMAKVLDVLMTSVNIEKYHIGFIEMTEKMVNIGIDSLVFKNCYEISMEQEKEQLLKYVRCYLETDSKGIKLCNNLRQEIASNIKSYSDYYNIYRYNPTKRKTLGTANIRYIAKVVTGLFLCVAETEEIEVIRIINEIKQIIGEVC